MRRKVFLSLAIVVALVVGGVPGCLLNGVILGEPVGSSPIPTVMNYQGTLLNQSTGDPVPNGQYSIVFSIYNTDTGGSPLWNETQSATVHDGLFSVMLGNVTPLTASLFDGSPRYLGVKVEADDEMTPRQLLASVPYAFHAESASTLDGMGSDDFVHVTGGNMTGTLWVNTSSDIGVVGNGTMAGVGGNGSIAGVYGFGGIVGVYGNSTDGTGVAGFSDNSLGVYGHSDNGTGVYGESDNNWGVHGYSENNTGVHGGSTNGWGVNGWSDNGTGVIGGSTDGTGVIGNSENNNGVFGSSKNGNGVNGYSENNNGVFGGSTNGTGVYGESDNNWGVHGYSENNTGVNGWSDNGTGVRGDGGTWDFYAAHGSGGYGPFTGAHEVKLSVDFPQDIQPGMIVSVTGEVQVRMAGGEISYSSTLPTVQLSDTPGDSRVFGVLIAEAPLPDDHWYISESEAARFGIVNALGEGRVWVTSVNGDIQAGDYITTSAIAGCGQRQDDDLLHSYTLGKAIEDVDWSEVTETVEFNGNTYKAYPIAVVYTSG